MGITPVGVVADHGLTPMANPSQSECGCVWQRTKEYGDVVAVQCVYHAWFGTLTSEQARVEVAKQQSGALGPNKGKW